MENSNHQDPPGNNMDISYKTIRKWVGILGLILTALLVTGTLIFGKCDGIRQSVSSYYYTLMGNFLTGILCAVALFMFTYKGYTTADGIWAKIAGFGALVTAIFPTDPNPIAIRTACDIITKSDDPISNTVHYISAGIFFLAMAYMSIFLFTKSDKGITERGVQKRRRNRVYRTCGIILAIAAVCIPLLKFWPAFKDALKSYNPEFWFESIVLWSFGISWLVKGEAILKD